MMTADRYARHHPGEDDPMIQRLQLCYRIFVHLAGTAAPFRG